MVEAAKNLVADAQAQTSVGLGPPHSIAMILTVIAVVVHTVHELAFVKHIRLHLASIEHPGILVLLQDESAVAEALAKVLHRVEPTALKSHIERVLTIRISSKVFELLWLLSTLLRILTLVASCLKIRHSVLFLKLT